jgi:nicotinamide-nucleotide amidase
MSGHQELAERVGELARRREKTVAVAESLTGGLVASSLAAAPEASTWFRGAIVAYASDVKRELLNVPPGPVVSEASAAAMAEGAARLLGADVTVALTGVGGPDRQDGEPPGTVWFAVRDGDSCRTELRRFSADGPAAICGDASTAALELLAAAL